MNIFSFAPLLQAAAALLLGVQNNPQVPQAAVQQAIATASLTVQMATEAQAISQIHFSVPMNHASIWTTIDDLRQAAYLDVNGNYTPQGTSVGLREADTSFGPLNNDGLDDAAIFVQRTDARGNTTTALGAMINLNGMTFNIADRTLGKNVQIFSHHVVGGGVIELTMNVDGARATYRYQLVGNELLKI